jgi:hypothetical protein
MRRPSREHVAEFLDFLDDAIGAGWEVVTS